VLICLQAEVNWGYSIAHPDYGCASCHVPHNSAGDNDSVPLWNPEHTTTTLDTFYAGSNTFDSTGAAPDGGSKLCLSCHDGTYDHVDSVHSFGTGVRTGFDEDNDGNDDAYGMGSLENSHPISIDYATAAAADSELKPLNELPAGAVDGHGKVQCSSCHDPHATAADYGADPFKNLRWTYSSGPSKAAFCRNCHVK